MVKDRPLRDLLPELAGRRPFALSRWGDAEWHALFGETNGFMPRDGYFYFAELQQELWKVLHAKPAYRLSLSTDDERAQKTISACELDGLDWSHDPFSKIHGLGHTLHELARAVLRKPVVMVGPPKYRHLNRVLRYDNFVDVPPKNAYLCRDHLVRETLAILDDFKEPAIVSVSAGVCAPLIIDDLYKIVGTKHQLVDFGGLWSYYLET